MFEHTETAINVALIASFSSLAVTVLNYIATGENARRQAIRSILEQDIRELGNVIYSIVAHSKILVEAGPKDKRDDVKQKIEEGRGKLNTLRGKVRYSLWGMDEGFRAIRSVPVYAAHCLENKERGRKLIRMASTLRGSLDKAISDAYALGQRPSTCRRLLVKFHAWRLRRSFERGASKSSDAEQSE